MSGDSKAYIAALDVGTTTLRCQIIDSQGKCQGAHFDKVKLHYPEPGHVEINPHELWTDVVNVVNKAVKDAKLPIHDIKTMGISTQRATFITWSKSTGQPFSNFITWKDLRASDLVEQVNKSWTMLGLQTCCCIAHTITRITKLGIVSNLKFTSSHVTIRLLHQLKTNPALQRAVQQDDAMFGTMETWLVYRLTGGATYVSDVSNASATGLYDPFSHCWSFLARLFNIPLKILPEVVNCDYDFGCTEEFGPPIKINAVMGDQSASMYGSCSFNKDDLKLTIGTGAFLNLNTGLKIQASKGLYPLIGWKTADDLVNLVEVACSDAGSLVQWLLSIGLISTPEETSDMAISVKDSGGVFFIPAFSGLGPPINNEGAASGFIGVTPSTSKQHLVRAVLESIVYRTTLAFDLLKNECSQPPHYIRVDGGVAQNDFICQLLADLTGLTVGRFKAETATLGVAYMAGLGCGLWTKEDLVKMVKEDDVFEPSKCDVEVNRNNLNKWETAARRFVSWYGV